MTFAESVKTCLGAKYCCFKGRACRSEYWWFSLFIGLINVSSFIISSILPPMMAAVINFGISAGVLLPNIGVSVRRLHDRNMRGWWLLVPILSLFSWVTTTDTAALGMVSVLLSMCMCIALLVIFCLRGTPGPNRFGPDPLGHCAGTGQSGGNGTAHDCRLAGSSAGTDIDNPGQKDLRDTGKF